MRSPAVFPALRPLPQGWLAAAEASFPKLSTSERQELLPAPEAEPPLPATPAEWFQLLAGVPGWLDLVTEAHDLEGAAAGDAQFCQHTCYVLGYRDHPSVKRRIHRLVGFHSDHADQRVRTSAAWDFTTRTVLNALPGCRQCGCLDDSDSG